MGLMTPFKLLVLGLLGLVNSLLVHYDLCQEIMYVDCKSEAKPGNRLYRDNNGQVYDNFCLYTKAKCKDSSLDLDAVCTCQHPNVLSGLSTQSTSAMLMSSTTMKPVLPISTSAPIASTKKTTLSPVFTSTEPTTSSAPTAPTTLKVETTSRTFVSAFCQNKDSINCPSSSEPLCASDNKTYASRCELAKAQCDFPDLTIAREGAC